MSTTMQVDESSVGRYYDPATGQFLSVDPLVAATEQPYSYAGNNPVNVTDPSGLCSAEDVVLCLGPGQAYASGAAGQPTYYTPPLTAGGMFDHVPGDDNGLPTIDNPDINSGPPPAYANGGGVIANAPAGSPSGPSSDATGPCQPQSTGQPQLNEGGHAPLFR